MQYFLQGSNLHLDRRHSPARSWVCYQLQQENTVSPRDEQRSHNLPRMKRVLCQLSYPGIIHLLNIKLLAIISDCEAISLMDMSIYPACVSIQTEFCTIRMGIEPI